MKRGFFLDLDGTLVDSLTSLRETYLLFLSTFKIQGSEAEFQEFNGPPLDQVVKVLRERYQLKPPASELLARYRELVRQNYLQANPNPGASEVLDFAIHQGWTCGVVTSNSESLAREWLSKNNLLGSIQDVIGGESVRVGKPDPEPYLLALHRLQCKAETSMAVEDSPAGIASAAGAQIQTFAYFPSREPHGALPAGVSIVRSLLDLKPWLAHA